MAKESIKARERKRERMVAQYAAKRAALKEIVRKGEPEDVEKAVIALQKLPKNACPVRLHNRCKLTGRPKGYMRQFGISRINFREMALAGLIPGVKKSSW
ncbi:MAG: 30S ribosomal protein S14 [Bacteroidales bacterium]|nr:30S ribosomal protein S14 [Candidatus Colimorpha pelethequi]MCQ2261816.1 30S ribosomal protein S14 [Bacteroidales bacterium]